MTVDTGNQDLECDTNVSLELIHLRSRPSIFNRLNAIDTKISAPSEVFADLWGHVLVREVR